LNTMQSNLAETVIHWHKFFTTFIEVYFYAHGAMGVLHILIEKYKSRSVNQSD
ncbi:cytochrome b/b6 domain-containing protein, partial [Klebsiella michiganensis]